MPEELTPQAQAVEDFLQGFRVAINYIFLYSKEHSAFVKSVAELKKKIDNLFDFVSAINISFTPDHLIVDGVTYDKKALHKELAKMFHLRKIASVQLLKGITADELAILLEKAALPAKDIIKAGGVSKLIDPEQTPHFSVADLDYSHFLKDTGEETSDIWNYMLRQASQEENLQKIEEFADNFESFISKVKPRDLVENPELSESLGKFFAYLKEKDREKFRHCARSTLKLILKDKNISMDAELSKMKAILNDLGSEDLAYALWDGISSNERFDSYSFDLFSKLVAKEKHQEIASRFSENVTKDKAFSFNSQIGKKIEELFFASEDNQLISGIYHKAIAFLGKDTAKKTGLVFDRKGLEDNYRFILLNLLVEEKNKRRLQPVVEKILGRWPDMIQEPDPEYFKCLKEALEIKKDEPVLAELLSGLNKQYLNFIENMIWKDEIADGFQFLVDNLEATTISREVYLRMMFEDKKATPLSIRLYLRFFPDGLKVLYDYLKSRHSDIELLGKIISGLQEINSPVSLQILEYIFSVSNDLVKAEVLKAMAALTEYDKEFIFNILKKGSAFLRKESLPVALKDVYDSRTAADILFPLADFWGLKNKALLENIGIAEELNLRWIRDYLVNLSKRPFFWNDKVRSRAKELMEKWDARPD